MSAATDFLYRATRLSGRLIIRTVRRVPRFGPTPMRFRRPPAFRPEHAEEDRDRVLATTLRGVWLCIGPRSTGHSTRGQPARQLCLAPRAGRGPERRLLR